MMITKTFGSALLVFALSAISVEGFNLEKIDLNRDTGAVRTRQRDGKYRMYRGANGRRQRGWGSTLLDEIRKGGDGWKQLLQMKRLLLILQMEQLLQELRLLLIYQFLLKLFQYYYV